MERTTNSADARRAADYLSRYCDECASRTAAERLFNSLLR